MSEIGFTYSPSYSNFCKDDKLFNILAVSKLPTTEIERDTCTLCNPAGILCNRYDIVCLRCCSTMTTVRLPEVYFSILAPLLMVSSGNTLRIVHVVSLARFSYITRDKKRGMTMYTCCVHVHVHVYVFVCVCVCVCVYVCVLAIQLEHINQHLHMYA